MKSVLISIKPHWCEPIASGKKTIEIRKSKPKLETPFKCYIYMTSGDASIHAGKGMVHHHSGGRCVIGEFVCDTFVTDDTFGHDALFNGAACMSEVDAAAYSLGSPMYGWHISNLVIYDKPKNLSEFYIWKKCNSCRASGYESSACIYDEDCRVPAVITRPPQSWCYVEEISL